MSRRLYQLEAPGNGRSTLPRENKSLGLQYRPLTGFCSVVSEQDEPVRVTWLPPFVAIEFPVPGGAPP